MSDQSLIWPFLGLCRKTCLILFHFFFLFYLSLGVLDLHCCARLSLVAASRGYSLVAVLGLVIAVASLVAECGL